MPELDHGLASAALLQRAETAEHGEAGCALFVTNEVSFRGVARLPLVILDDLLKP